MRAVEIYERVRTELERLEESGGPRSDWLQLSLELMEAMIECQRLAIRQQQTILASVREGVRSTEADAARRESKSTLEVLEKLLELQRRLKPHLVR